MSRRYWFAPQVSKHHETFTGSAHASYANYVSDALEKDAAAAELSSEASNRPPTIIYLPAMMLVAYHMTQYVPSFLSCSREVRLTYCPAAFSAACILRVQVRVRRCASTLPLVILCERLCRA